MTADLVRIGSRGSRLALVQAEWVRDRVAARDRGLRVEIEIINTKGDKILDAPLAKIGDKGLFTKELETALLEGRVDVAVHSAKDMPTAVPEGLEIIAFTEREDVRDVFVPNPALLEGARGRRRLTLDDVPEGARVGTSSLRRRSQLLALRPDLEVVDIRGNVETRLRKLVEDEMTGTVLAAAGLSRLGRSEVSGFAFAFDQMLPAVGQGALAIEARADHPRLGRPVGRARPPADGARRQGGASAARHPGGRLPGAHRRARPADGATEAPARGLWRSPPTWARSTARAACAASASGPPATLDPGDRTRRRAARTRRRRHPGARSARCEPGRPGNGAVRGPAAGRAHRRRDPAPRAGAVALAPAGGARRRGARGARPSASRRDRWTTRSRPSCGS